MSGIRVRGAARERAVIRLETQFWYTLCLMFKPPIPHCGCLRRLPQVSFWRPQKTTRHPGAYPNPTGLSTGIIAWAKFPVNIFLWMCVMKKEYL
jgi:hypothetical protein